MALHEERPASADLAFLRDVRLATDRLVLRAPVLKDADRLTELVGDYEVVKWLTTVPWPYRRDHALEWLKFATGPNCPDLSFVMVADDGPIGSIGLRTVMDAPSLGYWLGQPYWGQGYMSEAVAAVLDFVFDELGASEVHSSIFDHNAASLRLQERFGFKVVGRKVHSCLARGHDVPGVVTKLMKSDYESFDAPAIDRGLNLDEF
ncbi:MAG: GNAT family N-acetyltransferase [Pseudomonadota bacterium]